MLNRCDFPNVFLYRIEVWKDTKERAANYPFSTSEKIKYNASYKIPTGTEKTYVAMVDDDAIILGEKLQQAGLNPLILNFADDLQPGGNIIYGGGAQEANIFTRTNLILTVKESMYPIRRNEAIYTAAATVFKAHEDNDYNLLKTPFTAAFISAPGLKYPVLQRDGSLKPADVLELKQRIHLIFQIAHQKGHDALVLGPLGCGSWRSPPHQVAGIFKSVIMEWPGVFKEIVFAFKIAELRYREETNFDIFRNVF